jgi:hypothetical protein
MFVALSKVPLGIELLPGGNLEIYDTSMFHTSSIFGSDKEAYLCKVELRKAVDALVKGRTENILRFLVGFAGIDCLRTLQFSG